MSEIKHPAIRYHGGKFRLAPWVISHFPAKRWLSYYVRQIDKEIRGQL
ncbi:Uncharacterised protein [Yersinia pseudotuberculosis]|nr:hypothetical protein BZ19_460 [Yersinia pseudotuberculosis str. PA3606]CNE41086.1 Uncharacterised protein [Yersinia similis]CNH74389.1 Uncharacterised protein [Yersinia pseudotuberculosis]